MHTPSTEELAHAKTEIARLTILHQNSAIDSPSWRKAVLDAASVRGWLHVAQTCGAVRHSLREAIAARQ